MKKQKEIIIVSMVISILLVVIPCVFDKLYFFAADDYLMNLIIKGAYSSAPDPFLVYNNVLLGFLLKGFYSVFPYFNWYALFQLGTVALTFSVINYSLLKLSDKKYEILVITGVLELIVVYHLTFTIVSYLCIGAGCVFLYVTNFVWKKEGKRKNNGIFLFAGAIRGCMEKKCF